MLRWFEPPSVTSDEVCCALYLMGATHARGLRERLDLIKLRLKAVNPGFMHALDLVLRQPFHLGQDAQQRWLNNKGLE